MSKTAILFAALATLLAAPLAAQDINADPTYETVSLAGGFPDDPYVVSLQSGGPLDASGLGGACAGFIAEAPDVRLHFAPGSLPLIISVASAADTTLVINAPDGNWYCNDDGEASLNPSIAFGSPMEGRYEIWVGTYGNAVIEPADLHISELYSN